MDLGESLAAVMDEPIGELPMEFSVAAIREITCDRDEFVDLPQM